MIANIRLTLKSLKYSNTATYYLVIAEKSHVENEMSKVNLSETVTAVV